MKAIQLSGSRFPTKSINLCCILVDCGWQQEVDQRRQISWIQPNLDWVLYINGPYIKRQRVSYDRKVNFCLHPLLLLCHLPIFSQTVFLQYQQEKCSIFKAMIQNCQSGTCNTQQTNESKNIRPQKLSKAALLNLN